MPSLRATVSAVARLSPVSITTRTPDARSSRRASGVDSLIGSATPTNPASVPRSAYVVSLPRVPGAPRVRAGPSHRHARRAAGDRGPWVSLPLRATSPEGNTVGAPHPAPGLGPPGPGVRAAARARRAMGQLTAWRPAEAVTRSGRGPA